ncbi:MAG: hypothetical protein EP346_13790 [Bacteroidetes bacterium]|uniref:DUF975 family protein n=1 Tax=Phaeocystidibacter marisrubri TaxID=1577780 RepID=A0A6L3ZEN6_9FLAO|nr:hypothetical protein [Phaeocystidibacter marisrubri]KAB2816086.1 hypothetical protein F8C82_10370 [Phaeocystidibacter marisrubri]TNE26240.1 MAG: hypothetical protein EP346_13790 [Bacteroidota bacterium]GGH67258.1 hypothetical protein GCM10011318_06050 [Phaeocystidibacter marisrubri]
MSNKVSFGKTYSMGFRIFGKTLGWQILYLIVFFIAAMVISLLTSVITGVLSGLLGVIGTIAINQLLSSFATTPLTYGFAVISDHAYQGKNVEFGSAFSTYKKIVPLFLLYLISAVVTGGVFLGLTYALMGQDVIELVNLFSEVMSSAQSGMTNSGDMQMYGEEIVALIMGNIGVLTIVGLITLAVGVIFFFPPYYVVFKNDSVGDALSKGINSSLKNLPVIILIMISLYIVIAIMAVIMIIPILGALIWFLVILPLVFSFMQAIFRQMEPEISETQTSDLDEILDLE